MLLANIGAGLTLLLGIIGLVFPDRTAGLVRLSARSHPERGEFRALYGGLFVGMGAVPLVTQSPAAFITVGAAWLGATLARAASLLLDPTLSSKQWRAVAFEGGIGALCLCALFA